MSAPHTPVQPARDTFDGAELGAYDHVVERQLAYDYPAFLAMVPAEHQRAFQNATLNPAGAEADPRHRVQPYMGAMLNSPEIMDHISELGVLYRNAGERGDGYAHADREWIDMVLGQELECWGVFYAHMLDGVSNGLRTQALRALRSGRDEELTPEELIKARHIRQVVRGTVTPESYAGIVELFGRRGAVEYTAFAGHLLMTIRLIQAFGAQDDFTAEMVDELITHIENGTVEIPDSKARIPATYAGLS
jgi:hypothetical protein